MIKKIIACADVHIRNFKRMDEYQAMLEKFVSECKNIVGQLNTSDEARIIIAGDVLHNKLDISGEGYILASWFLRKLDEVAPTIIIAGNHDVNMNNLTRLDPLSAIFSMCSFKQTIYLDRTLEYQSGCYIDDNVCWCLYSSFDNFAQPSIAETKIKHPELTYVGLFHGIVKGCKTDVNHSFENGYESSYFEGLDFAILGHIHRRQELTYNGIPLVYCGSLLQQDFGENVSGHGYVIWDVEELAYKPIDIKNEENAFYTFSIKSIDDLDNDMEEILNL